MILYSPGVSAHDLGSRPSRGSSPLRARAHARAREPTVSTVALVRSSTCVASPQVVFKRGVARSCVAPVAHVASGKHVVSADVALKRSVTCSRGLGEQAGTARCGAKTWRQGARWRRQMWHQTVASLAHKASGSQLASPDVASKRGVIGPCGVRGPDGVARCGVKTASLAHAASGGQVALPNVASKCGVTCPRQAARWHRWSCTRVNANGLTFRHRTWRQNVALLAHVASEPRGVAGRGVKTWRQAPSTYAASQDAASIRGVRRPRPSGKCLQTVFSVVGRYVHPHRRLSCNNR